MADSAGDRQPEQQYHQDDTLAVGQVPDLPSHNRQTNINRQNVAHADVDVAGHGRQQNAQRERQRQQVSHLPAFLPAMVPAPSQQQQERDGRLHCHGKEVPPSGLGNLAQQVCRVARGIVTHGVAYAVEELGGRQRA